MQNVSKTLCSCLAVLLCFATQLASAQELNQIYVSSGSDISSFSFLTDQKIVIRISTDGKLLEYGTDPGTGRYNYYSGKLQPFMGRIDYYPPTERDSLLRGKVRSIGSCMITYYGAYEQASRAGRIRSLGSLQFDYVGVENMYNQGKLKSIGYTQVDFYAGSENEAFRGKLKTIGNTSVTWYSSFEDKSIRGKIKSIGSYSYAWYASYDRGYGGMKSGSPMQNVNGVTFLVR